jgi:hypothetical protein
MFYSGTAVALIDPMQLSALERADLAIAARMLPADGSDEWIAAAQRALDGLRQPGVADAAFLASLLRLRGFAVADDDAAAACAGRPGRWSPATQEHRLLRGLQEALRRVRARAAEGALPDGWFLVELFRTMAADLPRFRNNDLRRGPPWDAILHVEHAPAEDVRRLVDAFDAGRCFGDAPSLFRPLHPVRQAVRIFWRFLQIAPFPDFNAVVGWLGMNAWLQAKGFPLLPAEPGDARWLVAFAGGPPPLRCPPLEARVLAACLRVGQA